MPLLSLATYDFLPDNKLRNERSSVGGDIIMSYESGDATGGE